MEIGKIYNIYYMKKNKKINMVHTWVTIYILTAVVAYSITFNNRDWIKARAESIINKSIFSNDSYVVKVKKSDSSGQINILNNKKKTLNEEINTDTSPDAKNSKFDIGVWSQDEKKIFDPFVIKNLGRGGNMGGSKSWIIRNMSNQNGRLFFNINNIINKDNGCNDQEKMIEISCDIDDKGELGNKIVLKISINGKDMAEVKLTSKEVKDFEIDWNKLPSLIFEKGEKVVLTLRWFLSENEYSDEIQSDSVQFDLNLILRSLQ